MIVAEGPSGRREIPAAEFFHGVFSTALEPDELIIEVVFPVRHRDVDLSEVRATPGVVEAFVAADLDLADITAMLERPPEEFVPTAMPVLARQGPAAPGAHGPLRVSSVMTRLRRSMSTGREVAQYFASIPV